MSDLLGYSGFISPTDAAWIKLRLSVIALSLLAGLLLSFQRPELACLLPLNTSPAPARLFNTACDELYLSKNDLNLSIYVSLLAIIHFSSLGLRHWLLQPTILAKARLNSFSGVEKEGSDQNLPYLVPITDTKALIKVANIVHYGGVARCSSALYGASLLAGFIAHAHLYFLTLHADSAELGKPQFNETFLCPLANTSLPQHRVVEVLEAVTSNLSPFLCNNSATNNATRYSVSICLECMGPSSHSTIPLLVGALFLFGAVLFFIELCMPCWTALNPRCAIVVPRNISHWIRCLLVMQHGNDPSQNWDESIVEQLRKDWGKVSEKIMSLHDSWSEAFFCFSCQRDNLILPSAQLRECSLNGVPAQLNILLQRLRNGSRRSLIVKGLALLRSVVPIIVAVVLCTFLGLYWQRSDYSFPFAVWPCFLLTEFVLFFVAVPDFMQLELCAFNLNAHIGLFERIVHVLHTLRGGLAKSSPAESRASEDGSF